VQALLTVLAGGQGLVLVLDDVHWADPASVELVAHLLCRAPEGRVLLAMAVRPAQMQGRLGAALAAAEGDRSGARLELRPLSERDAGALLEGVRDAEPASRRGGLPGAGGCPR
jgi:predicted ATPase